MKRLFLDTDVILDLLATRAPFYDSVAKISTLADQNKLRLITSPVSFTKVEYVLSKFKSADHAIGMLRKFRIICDVCAVNQEIIDKSLNSEFKDFEDAVQYFSAFKSSCSVILTRNGKYFKHAKIPVMTADEFLKSFV